MFELIGIRMCKNQEEKDVIATFDLEEDAESYIEKSSNKYGGVRFHCSSLLFNYDYAVIIKSLSVPHNPKI
jgi:hypothetical protein